MANGHHDDISRFHDHFGGQISAIGAIGGDNTKMFKKALYVSFLDTISHALCDETKITNSERFTNFVRHFGSWEHCEKVSLPHLVAVLDRVQDERFDEVRQWARTRLATWGEESRPHLGEDPDFAELRKMWPVDPAKGCVVRGVTLERLQHFHLLYRYRNALIHEMRPLGYGQEDVGHVQVPYYLTSRDVANPDAWSWELTYPLLFLENLCRQALENSVTYLRKNNLDPFQRFRFGTYWYDVLNEE